MTPMQILFILIAVVTLGSALMVVIARNLVHSALWLIAALFGVAVIYGLLEAGFLAVVQIVIYIGAIAILMIFAIMLTRRLTQDSGPRYTANWIWAVGIAAIFFAGITWMLSNWSGLSTPLSALSSRADNLGELGQALVSPDFYVLPFELASVMLLAALIGAVVVAWERR